MDLDFRSHEADPYPYYMSKINENKEESQRDFETEVCTNE